MMVPVFARAVLATPMRAFVPGMLPSLASSTKRVAYLDYSTSATSTSTSTTTSPSSSNNSTANFFRLNDDINHNNNNTNDFLNGGYIIYITNGIIDHDYSTHYRLHRHRHHRLPLQFGIFKLCSSRTVRDAPAVRATTDPTAGGC